MGKYGKDLVIYPLSTEKVAAEFWFTIYAGVNNDIQYKILQGSTAIKVTDNEQPLAECIKAIRNMQSGDSEYTVIELFSKNGRIDHMNVAEMATPKH